MLLLPQRVTCAQRGPLNDPPPNPALAAAGPSRASARARAGAHVPAEEELYLSGGGLVPAAEAQSVSRRHPDPGVRVMVTVAGRRKRFDLRSLAVGAAVIVACDPAQLARFEISPVHASPAADSLLLVQARQIARDFAERYQMHTWPGDDECPLGRYFARDSVRGREVELNFCVRPQEGATEFRLVEAVTPRWGPKGNALRAELLDTLRTRFGTGAVHQR